MTTKEFREKLAKYGYTYKKSVVANDINNVAYISELSERYLETYTSLPLEVFYLICKYARTPIDEREEQPKYYWRLKGMGNHYRGDDIGFVYGWFNYDDVRNDWYLSHKNVEGTIKQFTKKEFRKLKKELNITAEFEPEEID